ncbi:intradiol ring-cleavage dioxygenase [Rhizoctonia solani]|uniref:Intradiol ring-cleavage dioxygenase n=1 Tax=Rhizoctonia solani TaxID=456999 RepID=A0A8H8SS62_9AGAM|nr:intradiol ring-cleavage dioxygenase [Rhizoctonia solani]QRW15659.1 intradiol ring-cleavage dioxygenase [Rhizoctonia solani]
MLPKTLSVVALGLTAVAGIVSAHPGEAHSLPRAELGRRQLEANKRHLQARNCASQIAEFNAKRKAKRALAKRSNEPASLNGRHFRRQGQYGQGQPGHGQGWGYLGGPGGHGNGHGQPSGQGPSSFTRSASSAPSSIATSADATITATASESTVIATGISTSTDVATSTASANSPTYSTIQNSTCVTAPEVTEGPYYVNNEYLRQDISEDQDGVPLVLDIGVIDVTTCQPLDQALVEIWHCNATGQYSGFTSAQLDLPSGGNGTAPGGNSTAPVNGTAPTGTESAGAAPTGGAGGGGMGSTSMTDQLTFLRGGWATNSEGMVEFKSIYPGYYTGRTVHIHTMVQTNYSVATNGSIISHAGSLHHIGQLFFEDDLNNKIVTQGAYANTTQSRTYNTEDNILDSENADGYNAIASTELLGETETDGILAYITIGVDPTFVGSITSTNYVTAELEEPTTSTTAAPETTA